MDPTAAADSSGMASLLRLAAALSCALVIFSFLGFATEEAGHGSQAQVSKLAEALDEPAPPAGVERERERRHSKARELVDDANDALLKPFSGIVDSHDPGALALLVYGAGLTLLANFLPRRTPASRDWRTAG
jgi:hypothetical protein